MPSRTEVVQPRLTRAAATVDIAAKAGLVVLLVIAVACPDLGYVRGKASGVLIWTLWRRRVLHTSPHLR